MKIFYLMSERQFLRSRRQLRHTALNRQVVRRIRHVKWLGAIGPRTAVRTRALHPGHRYPRLGFRYRRGALQRNTAHTTQNTPATDIHEKVFAHGHGWLRKGLQIGRVIGAEYEGAPDDGQCTRQSVVQGDGNVVTLIHHDRFGLAVQAVGSEGSEKEAVAE